MWRLCTASLFCVAGSVTSARVPASLPVPDVVGTWISATRRRRTFSGPTTSLDRLPAAGQDSDQLGQVHGAAAAEADHEVRLAPLARPRPPPRGSGCPAPASTSPNTVDLAGQAEQVDARRVEGIGDHQGAPQALALRPSEPRLRPCRGRIRWPRDGAISIGVKQAVHRQHPAHAAAARAARGGEALGIFDRLDQAALVGDALAGDVEGGAVIDGGADDRQAERDVDAGQVLPLAGRRIDLEAEQLDRDVALVVVHGDHGVVLPGAQLDEDRVAGHRPDHVEPVARPLSAMVGVGDVDVLPAEQAALAGMRIERRDGDPRRARMPSRAAPRA